MVMAQSLFRHLREQAAGVIDVLAPEWSLPVIARMPEVRRGIALAAGHGELALAARRRLGAALRQERYSQAIVLPRSAKSALVPFFARIPRRTGFRGELRYGLINDMLPFDAALLDQTVKRFVVLGTDDGRLPSELPQPELTVDADNQLAATARLGLRAGDAVALMPGAEYGPAKCWPLEYFSELAAGLGRAGRDVWVLGSARDAEAGRYIAERSAAANLCGQTSLTDAIDLLALCGQAVSNDSGLMHMAAAVGCEVHALYGSSSPAFTPPLTLRRHIHYLDLECSPCFERQCPLGHLNCLRQITPETVLKSLNL